MPLTGHAAVAEVRGGIGFLAAVELSHEVLDRDPGAVATVARTAREQGVLVRPLAKAIAVSPPLTATTEHIELIAQALEAALASL